MALIKLKTLYPSINAISFLLMGAVFIVLLNGAMKKNALREAEAKADIILNRNLSTHYYFSHELKPEVFRLTDSFRGKEYFHPSWMSSTYAVRGIEKNFQKLSDEDYYYKECAINARSPENEADAYESAFIREMNKNPDVKKRSEIRILNKKHYFVVLHRGEVMEESCLRCHSASDKAPAGLVEQYGDTRSFSRNEGEVVSAISLRIPLAIPYNAANELSKKLSLYLLLLLVTLYTFLYWSSIHFIFLPLTYIRDKVKEIMSTPEHLGEEIQLPYGCELHELTASFNSMSIDLRRNRDELEERVAERTSDLIAANEKLLELDQMKSQFLATMSHELRTPLNSILGYAQILTRNRAVLPGYERGLQTIQKSGEHLLALINDILDLSRIEAQRMQLYPASIHLNSFLQGIDAIIRNRAEVKQLAFSVEQIGQLPSGIEADEVRLRQVLLNLLGNAIKFTKSGKVALRVSAIGTEADSRQSLRFEIEDTGPGIDPEQLDIIFSPFKQAGNAATRPEGSGLGLTITRELVEMMGGSVGVESILGKGSIFRIDIALPVVAVKEKTVVRQEAEIIGYQGAIKTVLVVDDKTENRQLIRDMLEPLGFEIRMAENGRKAIEKALEKRPDLVLLDLVMPVMTGIEAVQEIRTTAGLEDLVVIAMSASVLPDEERQSLVVGCNAFLQKPVDMNELLARVEKFLLLTWIYDHQKLVDSSVEQITEQHVENHALVSPPLVKLQQLRELARTGNMRDIQSWAVNLQETDRKYQSFARHIDSLAEAFKEKELTKFVKECIEKTQETEV